MSDETPLASRLSPLASTGDHVWIVDSLDQQYGFAARGDQEHASLWIAQARCAQCGLRVEFRAADVRPCVPPSS